MNKRISCGDLIAEIAEIWNDRIDARMRQLELNNSDLRLLRLIAKGGDNGLTLREVERTAQLSQPTASRLVAGLNRRGLVSYIADKRDLRSKHVCLTEEGNRVFTDILEMGTKCRAEALSTVPEEELVVLENLLAQIHAKAKQKF